MRLIYGSLFAFKKLLILYLIFVNFYFEAYSCEQWIKDFAGEFCQNPSSEINPLKKFDNLKNSYIKKIKIKESSNNKININNILIQNIREKCKNKKQYILRIFR